VLLQESQIVSGHALTGWYTHLEMYSMHNTLEKQCRGFGHDIRRRGDPVSYLRELKVGNWRQHKCYDNAVKYAVKFQVEVFWILTPCSVVVKHQLSGNLRWYPTTTLHGVTTQKTSSWTFTTVKASSQAINSFTFIFSQWNFILCSIKISIFLWNLSNLWRN